MSTPPPSTPHVRVYGSNCVRLLGTSYLHLELQRFSSSKRLYLTPLQLQLHPRFGDRLLGIKNAQCFAVGNPPPPHPLHVSHALLLDGIYNYSKLELHSFAVVNRLYSTPLQLKLHPFRHPKTSCTWSCLTFVALGTHVAPSR